MVYMRSEVGRKTVKIFHISKRLLAEFLGGDPDPITPLTETIAPPPSMGTAAPSAIQPTLLDNTFIMHLNQQEMPKSQ